MKPTLIESVFCFVKGNEVEIPKLTGLRVESVVKNICGGKDVHKRKQRVGLSDYPYTIED